MSQCRLDSWLWAARFYKTRSLAALKIKKGEVKLCGKTITKPSSLLNVGNKLIIEDDFFRKTIFVEETAIKRVSYENAKKLYKIISKDSKEVATFFQKQAKFKLNKKIKRNLRAIKEKLHFISDN